MKDSTGKISRKQEKAIVALLQCNTHGEAAKATGVGEVTLWRWMQEPEFKEAFRNAKRRLLDQAITNLQRATNKAIGALLSVVEDVNAPASARVSGAKTILEMSIKAIQIEELETRLEKLEDVTGGRQ